MRYGRDTGRKFTTWNINLGHRTVPVEVRSVDNDTKFWVYSQEYGLDVESADLKDLREKVTQALRKQRPVDWKDYAVIKITREHRSLPGIEIGTIQLGVDSEGKKFYREHEGSHAYAGWRESGVAQDRYGSSESVDILVPETGNTVKVRDLLAEAQEAFANEVFALFGAKVSGRKYDFKANVSVKAAEAAVNAIATKGCMFSMKIGKEKR